MEPLWKQAGKSEQTYIKDFKLIIENCERNKSIWFTMFCPLCGYYLFCFSPKFTPFYWSPILAPITCSHNYYTHSHWEWMKAFEKDVETIMEAIVYNRLERIQIPLPFTWKHLKLEFKDYLTANSKTASDSWPSGEMSPLSTNKYFWLQFRRDLWSFLISLIGWWF